VRDVIERADRTALAESRRVHTIAKNVSGRLRKYLGIESTPLYPPPRLSAELHDAEPDDYVFFPGRISPPKRHKLVLEALARTRQPVRLRIAGTSDSPTYESELRRLAGELGVEDRIDWLGWVDESELVEGYARCRGVVFPPRDEDYGYVTLEGMLASKPVITCSDSGEPVEFVVDGETGLVTDPDPAALASALDSLWHHRHAARQLGVAGRRRYDSLGISWDKVLDSLLT
jgi:glycosyltransferase involved in cell wall biosynthesis